MDRRATDTRKNEKLGTRRLFGRVLLVFAVILVASGVLVGRILYLDRTKGTSYEKMVLAQQSYRSKEISYKRGDITDRNNNTLASSKKVYDLVIDPLLLLESDDYIDASADALYSVFGITKEELMSQIAGHESSQYRVMQDYKGLSGEKVTEFNELAESDSNIKGISFDERYERYYPYSDTASKVIGFCSSDGEGAWGIEKEYNGELSGQNGRSYGYFNSDLELVETVNPAVNGNTIVSTIDVNVQGVLERLMGEFQQETGSENMGCIIMNPQNGEIYAMSSYPEYDLNNPRDLSALYTAEEIEEMTDEQMAEALNTLWRNYCISDAFEPGSTFKPITVSACLDEGTTDENRYYTCDGYQTVGGVDIKCVSYSYGGHGTIDVCQALMESCNDVMMQLVSDLGRTSFLSYLSDFGFGKKTGIDLPGESAGVVFAKDTMHVTELATSSFGQGQSVTMIQMAAAISAVVNGGNYYQPHVVKEVVSESGATVYSNDDMLVRKVITESTSNQVRSYLLKTVEEGTASPAAVAGYTIGGKTGTAEKMPRGNGNYLVSFIGFTPADDPEVLIYVVIDEPHVSDQAHSVYATEFAGKVLKEVLPLLGIYQSDDTAKKDRTKAKDIQIPSNEVPDGGYSDTGLPIAEGDEDEQSSKEELLETEEMLQTEQLSETEEDTDTGEVTGEDGISE